MINYGRADDVLTRLRLEHCNVASYLKVIGKHADYIRVEIWIHFLFSCHKYISERQKLFRELLDLGLFSFSFKSMFLWPAGN